MKKLFSLLIALVLSFGTTSSALNEGNHPDNAPKEPPLPHVIVVVPWSVDTLRIECTSDIPPIIEPTVSSSCGMDDTTRSISTTFGACINERTIVRTWYYTDLCGDDTLVRQVIIVMDTIPPVVTPSWAEDTTYYECLYDVPPIQWPTVSDNCGIKDTTRSIQTWFGACINERTIKRVWIFRDSCDNEGRAEQVIIVKDSIPPLVVVPWAEDTTYYECLYDVPPIQWPTVSDNCGIKDTTRSIQTWFGACINERTIKRVWIFRDSCDNEGRAEQVIIVKDSIPPLVVVPWAEDTTYYECLYDVPPIQWPTVSDNCGIKDTTRSIQTWFGACINERTIKRVWIFRDSCDNEGRAEQVIIVKDSIPPLVVVPWAEDTTYYECLYDVPPIQWPTVSDNCGIKDTTRSIQTWFGACINERTIKRVWIFRDSCDNEGRAEQVIIVKDSIPPLVTRTWAEDTSYLDCLSEVPPIQWPTVTDNCGIKDTTRSIQTTFGACINERTIRRTWIFRDSCDNEGRIDQVIYVKDSIPPIVTRTWAEDTSYLECLSEVPPIQWPTATDNCGIKDTTRSIETVFGACINERTIRRTWIIRDSCDNEGRLVQMIYVNDTIPPDVTVLWTEDTVRIECASAIPAPIEPVASDNCGLKDTVFTRIVSDSTCINHLTIDRVWEYYDSCDNSTLARQVIIVNDDIPPLPLCRDTILQLDETGAASIVPEDLDGGTTDNCGFNLSASQLNFDCSDVGENMITLTATDSCNNAASCIAVVTVEDTIAPVVVAQNIVIFLDENGFASISVPDVLLSATDNCGIQDIYLSMTEFTCEELGYNTIELIVIDVNGNITVTEVYVTVWDSIAPVLVMQDIEIYLDENGVASIEVEDIVASSFDNCGIISLTIDQHDFDCSHIGDNVVYAHLYGIGGEDHDWATVTVIDDLEPVVVCIADTTIEIPEGQTHYTAQGDEFDIIYMADNCEIDSVANNINSDTTLAGEEFLVGTTVVTWSVMDQSGNWGECSFEVTISVLTDIDDYLLRYVRIYPNPTQSAVKIDLGSSYDRISMIVKDMSGKVMHREEYEGIEEIDLNIENYVNGVYFISLIADRKLGNYRIIKF